MSTEAPIWLPQAAKQRDPRGLQSPALCSKVRACCSGMSPETTMVFPRQNYHLFYLYTSLRVLLPPFLHSKPQFVLFYLCPNPHLLSDAPTKRSVVRGISGSAHLTACLTQVQGPPQLLHRAGEKGMAKGTLRELTEVLLRL